MCLSNLNPTSYIEDNSPLHPGIQEKLVLQRDCGRTVSRNLAEFMCESSTLQTVEIESARFHEDFFSLLAENGNKSAVNKHTFQSCSIIMPILIYYLKDHFPIVQSYSTFAYIICQALSQKVLEKQLVCLLQNTALAWMIM